MIFGRFLPHAVLAAFVAAGILSTNAEPTETRATPLSMEQQAPPVELTSADTSVLPPVVPPTPAAPVLPRSDETKWENLVATPQMVIDIDQSSVKTEARNMSWEVSTRMRIGFFQQIPIEGKTEKGWYYINEMVSVCGEDVLRIRKSTVYDIDGKPITSGMDLGDLKNPKNAKSFVTVWLHVTCKDLKNKKVPITA